MDRLLILMLEFFKTGLFAVGGGLATIPFLSEIGIKYGWYSSELLSTMIAISESTPGPIGVNMATYVGYTSSGLSGALVTTLSLVAPSLIVIVIIAQFYQQFKEAKIVKMIFAGIKPAVVAFVFAACLSLFSNILILPGMSGINIKSVILLIALLLVRLKYKDVHPIAFIVVGAVVGVLFQF